jgi:cardiolipin synthase
MHRKIVVVDGKRAFVGGINYSADHLADFGPAAKQDYAVQIEGPVIHAIRHFALQALELGQTGLKRRRTHRPAAGASPAHNPAWDRRRLDRPPVGEPEPSGEMAAMFVTRDNTQHTSDIERHYRIAIRAARERVIIANAYFFPGYRLLRELRKAARRGVRVELILQGEPDMPIVKTAGGMLYHHLLAAGVRIFEYHDRPLHGKVATSDNEWATVGSSNLDPLSLSLNLEANVMVRDRSFNAFLTERLEYLIEHSCKEVDVKDLQEPGWWRMLRSFFVFHLLRRYPAWAGWLPAHAPRLTPAEQLIESGVEQVTEPKTG